MAYRSLVESKGTLRVTNMLHENQNPMGHACFPSNQKTIGSLTFRIYTKTTGQHNLSKGTMSIV